MVCLRNICINTLHKGDDDDDDDDNNNNNINSFKNIKTIIEIQGIWNVKAKVILIIIGVTGTIL